MQLKSNEEWVFVFNQKVTRSLVEGIVIDHPIIEPPLMTDSSHRNPKISSLEHRFSSVERKKRLLDKIGGFWDSLKMKILFNPNDDETIPSCLLQRIQILDSICDNNSDLKGYVEHVEKEALKNKQFSIIQKRAHCLRGVP
uniref:Uncharacterized protein n=1 Tax=Proboscia inermis TaxID=420281 RepID=A0A7S0CFQ8_9STRA|mmetsp:Transcript_44029/g.44538  ORF Transcript_44029/g.44538 Transcript_44029/m.44538 type:complete len:141 (+) Transcript_44029:87-509(+)